jgi:hypothetical protein
MGGHGGLNILPQKSWNVYGAKQRARVERDEAKAREDAEEAARRVLESARNERYEALSRRAVVDETTATTSGQHVNLFAAEERAAGLGGETQKKKKILSTEEARGDRFGGHGVGHGSVAPWYARASGAGGDVDDGANVVVESLPRRARRRREEEEALRLEGRRGKGRRSRDAEADETHSRIKTKSSKESSRRRKRRRRDDGKSKAEEDDLEDLRQQRLEREAKEADRVKFLASSR